MISNPKNDAPSKPTTIISGTTANPHLIEGDKLFVFNQTGNIMISTTQNPSDPLNEDIRAVFNEVSVFFAAMTKAITTTYKVNGDHKKVPYSMFDYDALERVIGGSGCFMKMTQETVQYSSKSFGMNFSRDLLAALLGLPGSGAMAFAASLVASIGAEGLKISMDKTSLSSKVGTLIFVCEYLMGMPIVTATALYVDSRQASSVFQAGPCLKTNSITTEMTVYKDVYYFVTPALIHRYAGDLDSIIGDEEYGEFISFLRSLIEGKAYVIKITDKDGKEVSSLSVGHEYVLLGSGFGSGGSLKLGQSSKSEVDVPTSSWMDMSIHFKLPQDTTAGEYQLSVHNGSSELATRDVSVVSPS